MKKTMKLPYKRPFKGYHVDAHQWDFKITPGLFAIHEDQFQYQPELPDMRITKEGINYELLRDTSIFTVGGYAHYHDGSANDIWVMKGSRTQKERETTHVGIMNFQEVETKVHLFKMNQFDIYPFDEKTGHYPKVRIHMPAIEKFTSRNKLKPVVGISILGEIYWVGLDGPIVTFSNPSTLVFDLRRWHLLEKVYHHFRTDEQRREIGIGPGHIDSRLPVEPFIDTFNYDEGMAIRNLFAQHNSFIIVLEPQSRPIRMYYHSIAANTLPNRYFVSPDYFWYQPLRLSDGRYTSYIVRDDLNGLVIATEPNKVYPQQLDKLNREDVPYIQEMNVSNLKGNYRTARLLNVEYQ